jgi:hypothetical protein
MKVLPDKSYFDFENVFDLTEFILTKNFVLKLYDFYPYSKNLKLPVFKFRLEKFYNNNDEIIVEINKTKYLISNNFDQTVGNSIFCFPIIVKTGFLNLFTKIKLIVLK